MTQRLTAYLAGMLTALAISALLLILLKPRKKIPIELLPPPTPGPIQVHVAGSVNQPGVYSVEWPAIIEDAIMAAGGPTSDADLDRINLAEAMNDGDRIFVPGSVVAGTPESQDPLITLVDPALQIDINHPTLAQLKTLPGIGPSISKKIVEYREQHGFFTKIEDLLNVSGIGPAKLGQFQDYIRFE